MDSVKPSTIIRAAAKAIMVEQALEDDPVWAQLLWNAAMRMQARAEMAEADEALVQNAN